MTVQTSTNVYGSNSGIQFQNSSTAGDSQLTLNGGGAYLVFGTFATAGDAHIQNNGGRVTFNHISSGGNAVIENNGGFVAIEELGDLSTATVRNTTGRTYVNLSTNGAAIGSLSGAGDVVLGAKSLTVGGLGLSDTIAGTISDKGPAVVDINGVDYTAAVTATGGSLVKVGAGTLTLTGDNTYTGGTTISSGALQLGNGGSSGSVLGTITNNAALIVNRSDSFTMANAIGGSGSFSQAGSGTTTLSGINTYAGSTTVAAGTLRAGAVNTLSAASAHSVAAGATLDLAGFSQSMASLSNSGTVSLVGAAPGTTLTVNGPYVGNNGTLRLGTTLGASGPSDRLVLDGASAVASGSTTLQISNLGGLGGQTVGNGIEVITGQNGANTTAQTTRNAFALGGRACGCGRLRVPPVRSRCDRRRPELVPALGSTSAPLRRLRRRLLPHLRLRPRPRLRHRLHLQHRPRLRRPLHRHRHRHRHQLRRQHQLRHRLRLPRRPRRRR